MKSTLNHWFAPAEVCRTNGWTVGTRLVGNEGFGDTVIQLTALGEKNIFAKMISHDGQQVNADESLWTLGCRDWREVPHG
jgi:hypothetical protein